MRDGCGDFPFVERFGFSPLGETGEGVRNRITAMNHFIEIRILNLKPGTREEFHRLYIEEALPLLKRWNFDVVAHGPSLHAENIYYVIRCYDSLAQREQMEDAYYASDDWRRGPREAMLALIENYTDIVLELDEVTVQRLREMHSPH